MSSWGRLARAARHRLRGARERLGCRTRLVGLVRPEPWTTQAHLDALAEALREVSPTAVLLVARGDDDPVAGCDGTDLLLRLEPDAVLDPAVLRGAVDLARERGLPVVCPAGRGGPADPRNVVAPAARWTSTDASPLTARAVDVAATLGDATPGVAGAWWTPGAGDSHLPLAEQRRFRVDLAEERTRGLLELLRDLPPSLAALDLEEDLLARHLPRAYVDAIGGGPAHLEALRPLVRDLVEGHRVAHVPVSARRAAYAAAHGTWEDLALLLDHDGDHPTGLPYDAPSGLVDLPDGLSAAVSTMPEEWRRIEDVDRVSHAALLHAWREGDETHLLGVAWTDYRPGLEPDVQLGMGGVWLDTYVRPWEDGQVAVAVGRAHEHHVAAGFRVVAATGTELSYVRVGTSGRHHVIEPDWIPDPPRGAPRVVAAEVGDATLRVTLDAPVDRPGTLVGPRGRAHAGSLEGRVLTLPLTATSLGADGPLPSGRYRLDGPDVGAHPRLLAEPSDLHEGATGVALGVGPAGRLQVHVGTALTTTERSARGQRVLRERPPVRRPRTVLLEAFHGRSADDNVGPVARALHDRAPDLDLALVVDDPRVTPPPGVRAVVRRSAEWHELLRGAAAYVGNAAAPSWWTKPPGMVHLQTWHGTPLKRIGEDRGPGDLAVWRHRRDVAAQAAGWDALVSANPLSSRAFRTAFRYDGPMLESGYPRNDLLVDPERRAATGARVRRALGLSVDQRVVLYAPTWREHAGVRDAKPLFLDAPGVTAALPDAVVLVRGHYNAGGSADAFAGAQRVVDVTRFPDVAPLFCAADVLVTDYSSVMFDFALLDRPIVLLTPDLEHYRDVERGFYVDLESHAPGELVRTTSDVVDLLRAEDTGAAARAAFREEFCPWDDGRAAGRAADWVLAQLA
ncbi:CDP-glycerol glycerophosphotransferase family protein [Nocardioides marmoribigeumensis]|uniref:CDP-glycerol glycerophosphotransferase (TagB/SpsB family) n=1 Tax=Nocardioides marmoribigeumensis TaxID=433649 RepID=A0ABU2BUQ0_9ACTN|nr:CDP-glycerol glycerophosphotransferase family protein [Nocardioides marmoribigeumensis]MDR7361754.1 CDP-glycerol glycerophosphotransferase (TagB/SpsB family) [Nocardioides marmoribigeumensis]